MSLLAPYMRSFAEEIEKLAASSLRQRFRVQPRAKGFDAFLGDKQIGYMDLRPSLDGTGVAQIRGVEINPQFRGMGLGRKFYGEVMRRLPSGQLESGAVVSPDANRVWKHLERNPAYTVERNPGAVTHQRNGTEEIGLGRNHFMEQMERRIDGLPRLPEAIFKGSITPKARLTGRVPNGAEEIEKLAAGTKTLKFEPIRAEELDGHVWLLSRTPHKYGMQYAHTLFDKKDLNKKLAELSYVTADALPLSEISGLWVSPNQRGKGLSKKLVQKALSTHPEDKFVVSPDPWKDKSVSKEDLRQVYKSFGFVDSKKPGYLELSREPSVSDKTKEAQVSPYQQKTQWTCSAACLKAVLNHWGHQIPEFQVIGAVGAQKGRGAECDQIAMAARTLGFASFEYSFDSIDQARVLLDQDIPIICDIQSFNNPGKGHYVVMVAADDERVELMDPNTPGNWRVISRKEMDERWWDRAMAPPHDLMPKWGIVVVPKEEG